MTNVDYRMLKNSIIKSCTQKSTGSMHFRVDFEKLSEKVKDLNLVPVNVGMEGKKVGIEDIPYISEYFEKSRLSWFTESKCSTVICFVDSESIDDKAKELINKVNTKQVDEPDVDKVEAFATLVAEYPCYFATIVSYQSNDPKRVGRISYEIVCRANKVVIKSSDYQYNPKDFS